MHTKKHLTPTKEDPGISTKEPPQSLKAPRTVDKLIVMWARVSAQKQLLVLGILTISALVTFTAWVWVDRAQRVLNQSVEQFGVALAHALARGGAESLTHDGNLEGLKYYILTECQKTPSIVYIVFCDPSGKVMLDSESLRSRKNDARPLFPIFKEPPEKYATPNVYPSPYGYRPVTNIAVPMEKNNEKLGMCWVGLDSNAFTILGTQKETRNFLVSIFGLVGLLGALGLWANYALINRPLRILSQGASEIAAGRFGHQIKSQRAGREIDHVVNAFNYMSSRLQQYDKQNVDTLMAERNKFISERNKLELVLMSIADGVVVCDRDNKVQIVNAAATQLFAKEAKELLGKPLIFCTEEPDSPQICHIVQAFTDTVSPGTLEPVVQSIHLGDLTVRLHIAPISLNQEFLGSVMIMHDVTREAELEKMKNEFISNVSHELRTPITSIKTYVDTLCNQGEKLDPDIYREFLEIIDNEADRLMYLVNDVLELSRIEEGDRELELIAFPVSDAVEQAVRSVNLMARDRELELKVTQGPDVPDVYMNRESIERVAINLLTNAIKYTPAGGTIEVLIDHLVDTKEVRVSVKDNGIGIPEECLPQIFDRFYRVERKVHTIKGTGLGLTIVTKIIEKHKGRVTVESALGQGSTFSFFLPTGNPYEEPEPLKEDTIAISAEENALPKPNVTSHELAS